MTETGERILLEALDLAPSEREAFLADACGGDDALRREILSLLEAGDRAPDFLSVPAFDRLRPPPLAAGATFAGYRIERLLGGGGAGTVYLAWQREPERPVALKVLDRALLSREMRHRLREEAATMARLDHPDVAHVYEAGHEDGVPWFAMEYVPDSQSLLDYARSLPERRRLEIFARVCDAVHHGHQKGILHRDLKPANVLVREPGRPKVIDFGIAEPVGTSPAWRAGTLPYMSPESLEPGADLDVRSDVYSLGVVLFQLLTGELPAAGSGPAPPGGDVGAIIGKAMDPDRENRYGSAAALADDVRRVLGHRPVTARPAPWPRQLGLFVRRRTALALALLALIVALVGGAAISLSFAIAAARERNAATWQAYRANVAAAAAALRAHDPGEARRRLADAPAALRGWEWRHLESRLDEALRTIRTGLTVRDGDRAAGRIAVTGAREVRVLEGGVVRYSIPGRVPYAAALTDDLLAVADWEEGVRLYRAADGSPVAALDPVEKVSDLAFDPEGGRLAGSGRDGRVRVWSVPDGRVVRTFRAHDGRAVSVAFGPGDLLATGGHDGEIRIWDLADGGRMATLAGHRGSVDSLAFRPDGTRLVSGSRDRTVRLWETATGRAIAVIHAHDAGVRRVAFAPDGSAFASASLDRTVGLWSGEDGRLLARRVGHESQVVSVAWTARGLVSFDRDGSVRFWPPTGAGQATALRGHSRQVRAAAFAPDGRLATMDRRGEVIVWDLEARRPATTHTDRDDGYFFLGFRGGLPLRVRSRRVDVLPGPSHSRDIRTTAAMDGSGALFAPGANAVLRWERAGAESTASWPARDVTAIAAHAGRRLLATGHGDGAVSLWRYDGTEPVARAAPTADPVRAVSFDPAGERLAVACGDRIVVMDAGDLSVLSTTLAQGRAVNAVAFLPDGSRLVSGGEDATVRLWDPATGDAVFVLDDPRAPVRCVAVDPAGRRIVAGGGAWDGPVPVWVWSCPPTDR